MSRLSDVFDDLNDDGIVTFDVGSTSNGQAAQSMKINLFSIHAAECRPYSIGC
jgi:hypothetical protein